VRVNWQTIQALSTNYTCHHLSSVAFGFSISLRGRQDDPFPCTTAGEGPKEMMQYSSCAWPLTNVSPLSSGLQSAVTTTAREDALAIARCSIYSVNGDFPQTVPLGHFPLDVYNGEYNLTKH
jgi:hypothetical protein